MTQSEEDSNRKPEKEEQPPLMGTWKRLYTAVIIYMCIMILALYLMTITLNR